MLSVWAKMLFMIIHVASQNPVKINATKHVIKRVFGGQEYDVLGVDTTSDVSEQPINEEVILGAKNRARNALQDADLAIGIEGGLIWNSQSSTYFETQYCAIIDRQGHLTLGHGAGFCLPPEIIEAVHSGSTLGDAMSKLSGIERIGNNIGAIGFLSKNVLNRTELTEQAVLMALIPRIRSDLYA